MREDDDEIGLYVGLLGRIIILFAVIIAVPVVLWTVTAVLRNQVPLPKVSTFHSLLATASTNAPGRATVASQPTTVCTAASENGRYGGGESNRGSGAKGTVARGTSAGRECIRSERSADGYARRTSGALQFRYANA